MAQAFNQTVTTHTSANDGLYMADWQQSPFQLTYQVDVPGGVTVAFTVQWTLADLNDASVTPVWLADPMNGTSTAVSVGGSYGFSVRAIRVAVTALSGGVAHIFFRVIQGSSAR